MAIYLTFWYTRKELALRIGYLFVSAAFAGAFGGLLATAIGQMDGVAGQRGWRWILIIEGLPSVVLGCVLPFVLADNPDSARWLTDEEKAYIRARKLRQQGENVEAQKFHWRDVRECFKDPKGAVTYLTVAKLSDRFQVRGWFAVAGGLISVLGYIILLVPASSGAHYLGCFFVAMGLYVLVGIPLSWLPNNIPRYGKRTSATGFQLTIGNASGVMAPFLYATNEKPRYIRGHAVSLAMVAFAACIYASLIFVYSSLNARRGRGEEDGRIQGKTEEEIEAMGDDSPRFRLVVEVAKTVPQWHIVHYVAAPPEIYISRRDVAWCSVSGMLWTEHPLRSFHKRHCQRFGFFMSTRMLVSNRKVVHAGQRGGMLVAGHSFASFQLLDLQHLCLFVLTQVMVGEREVVHAGQREGMLVAGHSFVSFQHLDLQHLCLFESTQVTVGEREVVHAGQRGGMLVAGHSFDG
ncbi:hypothetical protein FRC06_009000 [Ceratobasidium sp. 370]|nr:hypothetical protein FRC06_009000 [Ceratobasidium sp. 370]